MYFTEQTTVNEFNLLRMWNMDEKSQDVIGYIAYLCFVTRKYWYATYIKWYVWMISRYINIWIHCFISNVFTIIYIVCIYNVITLHICLCWTYWLLNTSKVNVSNAATLMASPHILSIKSTLFTDMSKLITKLYVQNP